MSLRSFDTYFFVFVISVNLIFSGDDAHLTPRTVFSVAPLHPLLQEILLYSS